MTLMVERKAGAVSPVGLHLQTDSMKVHACYHWWHYPDEPPAYANLRTPVVASIATLRAVSDVPITVFDTSRKDAEWGHFPEKLGFRVQKVEPEMEYYSDIIDGWPYLSRLYDVRENAPECDALMYVDSDVFWFKNPLPFAKPPDKFCFDGWNSGYFYYDPKSDTIELFHEIFDAYTKAAIYSNDVRKVMKRYLNYDGWYGVWDEMMLTYMAHHHPNLFHLIPVEEHSTARVLQYVSRDAVKMFHCNGTMVSSPFGKFGGEAKHSRGLMPLLVREFYEKLTKVLDEKDLGMMYTQQEMDYCMSRQFSLFDDMTAFLATKDEEGHYHAQRVTRS